MSMSSTARRSSWISSCPVVLEHITTADAVAFVESGPATLAATITPHHLTINRNAVFDGGIRPHFYCLQVAKREHHRLALRRAATSGSPKFFLGRAHAGLAVCRRGRQMTLTATISTSFGTV